MSITVKKMTLSEHNSQEDGSPINKNYLGLVDHIEVQCSVRIGTLKLTLGDLRQLKTQQILSLDQSTDAPVELLLNEQVIARGELMSHEDRFAIQITEVAS